jgi:hypothetical protein
MLFGILMLRTGMSVSTIVIMPIAVPFLLLFVCDVALNVN